MTFDLLMDFLLTRNMKVLIGIRIRHCKKYIAVVNPHKFVTNSNPVRVTIKVYVIKVNSVIIVNEIRL